MRRLLLPTLLLLGLAALPAGAQAAATTKASSAPVGGGPRTAPHPIDFLGAHWLGAPEGHADVRLRRGGRWGAWRALPHADAGPGPRTATGLVAARGATAYEVRGPRGARDVRAVAIDTAGSDARAARTTPVPLGRPGPRVCYRDRAAWGADETLRPATPTYHPVQTLTVHHTATEGGGAAPGAVVQAIQRFHKEVFGFDDIGYQLLIDAEGCVYEGRHSGDDRVPVFAGLPAAGEPFAAVNGAHTLGFNAGNVGVALLGDFTEAEPSPAALRALTVTLAALAGVSKLDPLGTTSYVNPISGATRTVPTISAHRDWLATECPGERLYARLPALRERAAWLAGLFRG